METQGDKVLLIVEDDADIRQSLGEVLQEEGFQVATAANGEEALRYVQENPPVSLILLDLMMPVMNGWEFATRLEQVPGKSATPVVIFSGGRNVEVEAKNMKAAGYLTKPVDIEKLLSVVEKYCR